MLRSFYFWVFLFSIAMALMEAAVVVYLRKIYFPDGFNFPLVPIEKDIGRVEFWREAATIFMLLSIGLISGRTASVKFALFIFCFAIWDIFYYIWLKIFIGWPESFLTWDILFLIPGPWVGPVITPIIVSLAMIMLSGAVFFFDSKNVNTRINRNEWLFLIAGSIVVIWSWMLDYYQYIKATGGSFWTLKGSDTILKHAESYIPVHFNWSVFIAGMALIAAGNIIYFKRMKKKINSPLFST